MREELKCKVYNKNTLDDLKYVVVCSLYNDKLLLSRHKHRDTWETQGGHIEEGETPVQAAKRELYKQSLFVIDWYKDEQPKGKVITVVSDSLDADLPDSYDKVSFTAKVNLLVNHFVDMAVQGYGWIYSAA